MSAEDSSTPYVKIEPEKWRGFGDIPMRNIPSESDASQGETEHLNPDTTVSTVDEDSMYHFDLESCFVSFSIPCHVIGKVGIRIGVGYPSLFFLYGFFFTVFNFCYYVFAFGVKPLCDTSNRIQLCSLRWIRRLALVRTWKSIIIFMFVNIAIHIKLVMAANKLV